MPTLRSLRLPHLFRGPLKRALGLCTGIGVLLILTGCGTQPTPPEPTLPSSQPSVESETSTTTEPEPTESSLIEPPVLPEAAKENSEEGAIAFAQHFIDVLNYSTSSLDDEYLEVISATDCKYCTRVTAMIQDTKKAGGTVDGLIFSLVSDPEVLTNEADVFGLEFFVSNSEYRILRGSQHTEYPAENIQVAMIITPAANSWEVHAFGPRTDQ